MVRGSSYLGQFIALTASTLFVLSFAARISRFRQELIELQRFEVRWFLRPAHLPPTEGRVYLGDRLSDFCDR